MGESIIKPRLPLSRRGADEDEAKASSPTELLPCKSEGGEEIFIFLRLPEPQRRVEKRTQSSSTINLPSPVSHPQVFTRILTAVKFYEGLLVFLSLVYNEKS
ncbi:MAG: hypothetical protein Q7K28_00600 [Candidatus Wildermuthbacteria bacterium]|nr:hypothetical protein [Candidatus Wildermuthbacteria bacterium]